MADLQYDTDLRNAQCDAIAARVGPAPSLMIYGGDVPTGPEEAIASPRLLAMGKLPEQWLAAAEGGAVSKAGRWQLVGQTAAGSGAKGTFFRIVNAGGACKMQGSFGDVSSGAVMRAKVNMIAAGQKVEVENFTIVRGNA